MKKRSLIAATAMFLVAILATTTATYAWFNAKTTATSVISMDVASGAGFQISADPAALTKVTNDSVWKTNLALSDFQEKQSFDDAHIWKDASTTDATFPAFFSDDYDDAGVLKSDAYISETPASVTIYFRATADKAIQITGGTLTDADCAALVPALRVGTQSTEETATEAVFCNGVRETNQGISAAAGTPGVLTNTSLGTAKTVVTALSESSGYYVGQITVYFWVEGTDDACVNKNSGNSASASLTFNQAA